MILSIHYAFDWCLPINVKYFYDVNTFTLDFTPGKEVKNFE